MAQSAAEARFGIQIEGRNQSRAAFDEVLRQNRELTASVERLISVSQQQARETHYINDAIRGASEEAKRMAAEQKRLAEETARVAEAEKKAAEATAAAARARRAARENMLEWATAAAATGLLLTQASERAGNFQEKIDLIGEGTGLASREIGALIVGASNIGRTLEQVTPSIDIFIRKLAEARQGDPAVASSFRAAGVTNLDQSTGAILKQIGAGLSEIEDPAERSRVAFELFGRSFRAVSQILSQDMNALEADAARMGTVYSGSMEEAARAADSSGDRIKSALQGIQNQISVGLATTGGNALQEFIAGSVEGFAEFIAWVNRSNEEVGHLEIGIQKLNEAQQRGEGPGTLRQSRPFSGHNLFEDLGIRVQGPADSTGFGAFLRGNFYGDAYTRYDADNPTIRTSEMAGPDLMGRIGTNVNAYGVPTALGPTVEEAQKALRERAAAEKKAADAAKRFADMQDAFYRDMENEANAPLGRFGAGSTSRISPTRDSRGLTPSDRFFGGTATIMATPPDLTQASLERFKKQDEEQKKRIAEQQALSEEFIRHNTSMLKSQFGGFIADALTGVMSLRDAFRNFIMTTLNQVISSGVQFGLSALLPGIQSGGIPMLAAQNGMVLSGVRGRDSVMAAVNVAGGEMIVDTQTADLARTLFPDMARFISEASSRQSDRSVVINLSFGNIDAGWSDPESFREAVNRRIMPEIARAVRYGTFSRAA